MGKYIFTLLESAQDEFEKQIPVKITEELSTVSFCLSIDLDNSISEMKAILKEVNDIKKELDLLENYLMENSENNSQEGINNITKDKEADKKLIESYYIKLLDFASMAMEKFETTESLIEDAKKNYTLLLEKFGEAKTMKISDFFTPFKILLKNIKKFN